MNSYTTQPTHNTGRAKPVPEHWAPLISAWLIYLAAIGRPATTINTRRQQLERFARAVEGLPGEVTADRIIEYLAAARWALDTRRGHRNALVAFFAWTVTSGRLDTDPARHLPKISVANPAPRPAPDRVVNRAIATTDRRILLMLRLGAKLGLRRAEIATVHTDDLEDGDRGAMLRVHGKGGKVRVIPIADELADIIETGPHWHTPGAGRRGWLFPGKIDGHLSPRRVGELCADAMPGTWTAHTLRHRFATRAYRGSRNLRAVQTLLGHSSVATTERYTAVDDDEVRAAMMHAA